MDGNFNNQDNNQQYNQGYPQQPLQQGYYQPVVPLPVGKAVASMVLGILSILLGCYIPYITIVMAIIAIILACISMKHREGGRGMAMAGLICAIIGVVIAIFVFICLIIVMARAREMGYSIFSPNFWEYISELSEY